MSYDLSFWRQTDEMTLEPLAVQRRLIEGHRVAGVAELPIAAFRAGVERTFTDWVQVGENLWEKEGTGSGPAFQLFNTPQLFHVTCYGLVPEDMNRFVDLALEFDCPLFDPQTGERFA